MYRQVELHVKLGRRKRSAWLGCLSCRKKVEFLKQAGVEEVPPEKQDFIPILGFTIVKPLYDEGLAICKKTGNYDEGEGYHPLLPDWEVTDGQGRKLIYHNGAARFVLPFACISFGLALPGKIYRRIDRGPPQSLDSSKVSCQE